MARPRLISPNYRLWRRDGNFYIRWTCPQEGRTMARSCGTADQGEAEIILWEIEANPERTGELNVSNRRGMQATIPAVTYVIANDGNHLVKVGHCTQAGLASRLRDLQTGSPVRLRLHGSVTFANRKAASAVERNVHKALSDCRVFGEWFDIDADLALQWVSDSSVQKLSTHNAKPRAKPLSRKG